MTPLATIRRYAALGLVAALLLALAWGARVDHLRAGYKAALGKILVSIDLTTGRKVDAAAAPVTIEAIGILRDRYRQERNEARAVVDRQSASIRAAGAETARLEAVSLRNRQLAEATVRERDAWIERAQAAETRTQRLSAEAELEECNAVLDALYRDGF
ncbi:hypothetical protein [Sphingomonas melonis]|uniref:Uncharacterized protein n=1 Tax=Sphingomonas melonis TaxID=152682 RepID=A0A7Y9K1V3_9SPHN|nr:hypothetical protein [Sphingomonas melonis]NYD91383.1 hypothetical protein [Sphingomonas melonis]